MREYDPKLIQGTLAAQGKTSDEECLEAHARALCHAATQAFKESNLPGRDVIEKAKYVIKNTPNWWPVERKVLMIVGLGKDERTFLSSIDEKNHQLIRKCADASVEVVYGRTSVDIYEGIARWVWDCLKEDEHGFDELIKIRNERKSKSGPGINVGRKMKRIVMNTGKRGANTYDPTGQELENDELWKDDVRVFPPEIVAGIGAQMYKDLIDPDNPRNKGLSDDIENDRRQLGGTINISDIPIVPVEPDENASEDEKEEYGHRMFWECWE